MLSKNESNQPAEFFMQNEAKIINFSLFFKKRSRDDFPLDSSWFVYPWPTQKCKKNQSDIIPVSNPLSDSSVYMFTV